MCTVVQWSDPEVMHRKPAIRGLLKADVPAVMIFECLCPGMPQVLFRDKKPSNPTPKLSFDFCLSGFSFCADGEFVHCGK